jgi:signal transduction histidine kinase
LIGNQLSKRRYKQKLRRLEEEYRLQLERERIARELHDNVGSQLTYLINKIDDDYPGLSEKNEAEKLSSVARDAMKELRETIWALDKKEVQWGDLHDKIKQLSLRYKTEKHLVELDWEANSAAPLNPLEALNIYRIIQEALNNAAKYSEASLVRVSMVHSDDGVCIEINDNGKGFDMQQAVKGYGLRNMNKRAEEMNACLNIETRPGAGTSVRLSLT